MHALIQQDTECTHVRTCVDDGVLRFAIEITERFWWKVRGCSESREWVARCCSRSRCGGECCNTEVDDFWKSIATDEDIRGLEITMNETNSVCVRNCVGNIGDECDALRKC